MQDAYKQTGVDYEQLDVLKRFAQLAARETSKNLPVGMTGIEESRGESAYVVDVGPFYLASVPEGLGTKNLVAESQGSSEETTHYGGLAKDTVAMIVNDLITVGARPLLVNAHWSFGSPQFLESHPKIGPDIAKGWADACTEAGALYAAGETPILKGIIFPGAMELSGSAVGIITPKERLTLGDRLTAGDRIILIESSGVHANGITLIRDIAESHLPNGYQALLPGGREFGEAILTPTLIYVQLQQALFEAGVDIHYMVNITGHGWRKLMRARHAFTYRMHTVPRAQEEFELIQQTRNLSDQTMYEIFNMGAGFAFMVPQKDVEIVLKQAETSGFQAWNAGIVEDGPKRVIIEPKDIIYSAESLNIR